MKTIMVKCVAWAVWVICLALAIPVNSAVVVSRSAAYKISIPDASQTTPSEQYSHGDPTDDEQYMLALVNRARAHPADECELILASDDTHILQALKTYKIDSLRLQSLFSYYNPKPPLAFNSKLIDAARAQSRDMADNNFQDHTGSDDSTLSDRLVRVGYDYRAGGENVFAYSYSPWYAQAAFLVDWGVEDLGHRKNLLDLGEHTQFREIGIGIISENDPRTAVGPLVITQDFGLSGTAAVFITGVVYRDLNGNHFYDPGEGLAGVRIMPDHGEYYAVTSSSGGYTIPVAANTGKYTLKTFRSDLPEIPIDVLIADGNVSADFILGDPAFATITGTVLDGTTNQPAPGVTVKLDPVNVTAVTDGQGGFIFSDLPATSYMVTAEQAGYEFQPNQVVLTLASGQNFRLRLTAQAVENSQTDIPPLGSNVTAPVTDPLKALLCPTAAAGLTLFLTLAFGSLQPRGRGKGNELNVSGGLVLWFKNCRDARTAYETITELAKTRLPPVTLTLDLADLDGWEMSHCVALRGLSFFEPLMDRWLRELRFEPVEEEIEQGSAVLDYYLRHAKILKSAHLPAQPPRPVEQLLKDSK